MIDLRIIKDDVFINEYGKLALAINTENIKQKIYIFLKLQISQYFYNISTGVPWMEFLVSNQNIQHLTIFLIDAISKIEGVETVISLVPYVKKETREMSINANIKDIYGNFITFN